MSLLPRCSLAIAGLVLLALLAARPAAAVPCSACHVQTANQFETSHHGTGIEKVTGDARCALCHGPGTEHVSNPTAGTIRTFGPGTPADAKADNAVCGTCHSAQQHPDANAHTLSGVACTSCHKVHKSGVEDHAHLSGIRIVEPVHNGSLLPAWPGPSAGTANSKAPAKKKLRPRELAGTSECIGCHQETAVAFAFNERHRLVAGGVACTSCHDPHNPTITPTVGGFGSDLKEGCSQCHADETGPFVFEHGAVQVEGCMACHSPHGSPNRHMLTQQDVGQLCYSCHAEVPQFHTGFSPAAPARFDPLTVCTNCHVAIHGSNHDPALLR